MAVGSRPQKVSGDAESCCFLWEQAHLRCAEVNYKTVLRSDQTKFEILLGGCGLELGEEGLESCLLHINKREYSHFTVWCPQVKGVDVSVITQQSPVVSCLLPSNTISSHMRALTHRCWMTGFGLTPYYHPDRPPPPQGKSGLFQTWFQTTHCTTWCHYKSVPRLNWTVTQTLLATWCNTKHNEMRSWAVE